MPLKAPAVADAATNTMAYLPQLVLHADTCVIDDNIYMAQVDDDCLSESTIPVESRCKTMSCSKSSWSVPAAKLVIVPYEANQVVSNCSELLSVNIATKYDKHTVHRCNNNLFIIDKSKSDGLRDNLITCSYHAECQKTKVHKLSSINEPTS